MSPVAAIGVAACVVALCLLPTVIATRTRWRRRQTAAVPLLVLEMTERERARKRWPWTVNERELPWVPTAREQAANLGAMIIKAFCVEVPD